MFPLKPYSVAQAAAALTMTTHCLSISWLIHAVPAGGVATTEGAEDNTEGQGDARLCYFCCLQSVFYCSSSLHRPNYTGKIRAKYLWLLSMGSTDVSSATLELNIGLNLFQRFFCITNLCPLKSA